MYQYVVIIIFTKYHESKRDLSYGGDVTIFCLLSIFYQHFDGQNLVRSLGAGENQK